MKLHVLPITVGLLFVLGPSFQAHAQGQCTIPLPCPANRIVLHQGPAEICYQDVPASDKKEHACERPLCKKLSCFLRRKCHNKAAADERVEVARTVTILPLNSLGNESAIRDDDDFPELRSAHRLEIEAARFKTLSMIRQAEMESTKQILERAHRLTETAVISSGKAPPPKPTSTGNETGQTMTCEERLKDIQGRLKKMEDKMEILEDILKYNLDKNRLEQPPPPR